jgi:hypothetical protein
MIRSVKIGDDVPFNVNNVKSRKNGTYQPDATITLKLFGPLPDRTQVGGDIAATIYDPDTASFEVNIPRSLTATFDKNEEYDGEIVVLNEGIQKTFLFRLKMLEALPAIF